MLSSFVMASYAAELVSTATAKEILQNPERSLLEARKSWHPPRHEAKQP